MSEDSTKQLPNEDLRRILARLDSIDERLTKLEDKVDRRLQETRPIWEQVLARLEGLENDLRAEMREGFEKSRAELNTGLRRVDRQIDVLNRNILEVRADLRYLDERVNKLESEPAQ
jgi:archaellum component FlaC